MKALKVEDEEVKQIVEKDKVVMADYEFTLKKLSSILDSIKN